MADTMSAARAMWTMFEPVHDVTYFAPEALRAFTEAGLRGYWRGYFAGRAAPLGGAAAAVVTAFVLQLRAGLSWPVRSPACGT